MTELTNILGVIAMTQPGGGDGGPAGLLGSPFTMLIIIGVMFYFILYMPEKKRKQERERMLNSLDRGDEVITSGGIYGKITALTDKSITVEIAPNVRIKVGRQFVSKAAKEGESDDKAKNSDKNEKKSKKDKDKDN
jgi:preprotein translocase subunit YajC